ncbi:MAG: chromate efflux transporter [Acidobacteriota bacterium]
MKVEETVRGDGSGATLGELARLFLRLGTISFGGPAAHIAMMEDEVVNRRRWLSRKEFLDLLGATNLIPGPNSTELAIHIGRRQAGWAGLLVAGSCFILPAALIVTLLAWIYVRYGSLPQANAVLYGVKPVIIAIVLQALWRLGRTALKTVPLALASAAGIVAVFLGINELIVLFTVGAVVAFGKWFVSLRARGETRLSSLAAAFFLAPLAQPAVTLFGLWPLFLFFVKTGSVLFGSGYVLLAFLRADLVERWHWLTESQLLDAIAVGQVTPGPVFTTATFIGYVLGGLPGALVATIGIFLPAFFFVAVSGPLVSRIRKSVMAGAFLDGVNAASLSLMAVVTWQLGRTALVDWMTVALLVASLILLFRFRLNSAWLVLGGVLAGLFLFVLK